MRCLPCGSLRSAVTGGGARRWLSLLVVSCLLILPVAPPAVAAPARVTERASGARSYLHAGERDRAQSLVAAPVADHLHAQAATIVVDYRGFPPEAQAAFQYAVGIWQGQLTSPVPIRITASWEPLDAGLLGGAAAVSLFRNFAGAPKVNTWYPSALANTLTGKDLDPAEAEIEAVFNSGEESWYFGTGQTPKGKVNFASTVLHEIAHGLGFSGSALVNQDGIGQWGFKTFPLGYDGFVVTDAGVPILDATTFPNPSAALAAQLQGGKLAFAGPRARGGNGGQPVKLYAPAHWEQGSSYSHLDEDAFPAGSPNALMTPYLDGGEANYNPGPIALGLLADLGWGVAAPAASPAPSPVAPGECATFTETGKTVCGRFLEYWQAHGGLAINGFPLTDARSEALEDGKQYRVQWFERVRMELHPENAPPYDVLLGQFGRRIHPADPAVAAQPGQRFFPETGHTMPADFASFWEAHGGLAQFGYPLTEPLTEILGDGKAYTVQYTERARLERHPENADPLYRVLLGQFGRQLLAGGAPTPSPVPSPAPMPSVAPSPSSAPVPSPSAAPSPPPPAPSPSPVARCDPSYPTVCIPPPPPDLDCSQIPYHDFTVLAPDPHGFDADHDGIGCESAGPAPSVAPSPSPAPPAANYQVTASVSNASPTQNTRVTVTARLTNNGQGVAGATLETTWHYKTSTPGCTGGPSGSDGTMSCTRDISTATKGYTVAITVVVSYQGQTFTTSTSFTPR